MQDEEGAAEGDVLTEPRSRSVRFAAIGFARPCEDEKGDEGGGGRGGCCVAADPCHLRVVPVPVRVCGL